MILKENQRERQYHTATGILTPVPAHLSNIDLWGEGDDHRGEKRPKHSLSSLEVYSRICSVALF
jgi:hypothetical protein